MLDTIRRYKYQMGGFQWKNPETGNNLQQGAGILGSFVSQLDSNPSVGGGAVSGALTGASAGAALGPIGSAAGAIFGGVIGGIGAGKKRREMEEQKAQAFRIQDKQFRDYSQTVLQSYPSQGVDVAGYYMKYGGKIPSFLANSLAEGGEVVMSNTPPETDQNGDLNQLASDVSKFEGASHESQSGGIGFNSTSDAYIFSDELRTPDGITYAKQAELIGKQKGKFEKKLEAATDRASQNTAQMMIKKLDSKLDLLFQQQEQSKNGKV